MKSKCKKLKREDFEQGIRNFFNMNPHLPHGCSYDFIYDSGEETLQLASNNEQSGGHNDHNYNSNDKFPLGLPFPIITQEEEEEESQRTNSSKSSSPSSLSTVPIESCSGSCSNSNSLNSASSSSNNNNSCTNISSDFINTSSSSLPSSENSIPANEDMLISSRPSTPISPYPFSIPSPPVSIFSTTNILDFDFNTDPQDIIDPDFLLALNDTDFSGNFSDIDSDMNDRNNNNDDDAPLFNKNTTNNIYHHDDLENIQIHPLNTKDLLFFNEDSNNSTVSSTSDFLTSSSVPSTSSQSNLKEMGNKSQDSSNRSTESCTNHHRHLIKTRGRNKKQLQNLYSPATLNRKISKIENEWRTGRRSERVAIRTAKLKSTSSTTTIHNNNNSNTTNTSSDNGDSNNSSSPPERYHFESPQSSRKPANTKKRHKNIDKKNKYSPRINSQKQRLKKQIINDGKTLVKISKFDYLTSDTTTMVVHHHHESLNSESTELVPFSSPSSASSAASSVLSKEFEINDFSSDEEEILQKTIRRRRKKKPKRRINDDTSPIVDTSKITRTLYEGIFPYETVEKTKNPDFRFTIGPVRQNHNSLTHDFSD